MSNPPLPQGQANGDRTGRFVVQPNGRLTPLSPHMQIWRWHVTMLASILFRVTIGAASVGAIMALGWIAAVACGPEVFAAVMAFMASPFGLFIGFGLTLVLFSFILNGARHLLNDATIGLDLKTANLLARIAVWGPIVLAILFWIALFASGRVAL